MSLQHADDSVDGYVKNMKIMKTRTKVIVLNAELTTRSNSQIWCFEQLIVLADELMLYVRKVYHETLQILILLLIYELVNIIGMVIFLLLMMSVFLLKELVVIGKSGV